jgi:UDP-N-acetylglucosamine 2-epimerase (non-hydrolysing)
MHVLHVVGARPNFMKVAPILKALQSRPGVRQTLVHTGQHYDAKMSDVFFQDLGMPAPDVHLGIGSGSHAQMTARVMLAIEPVLIDKKPDVLVVAGDVNSTLACALVAAKLGIAVAHVESGLRSRDWTMPEEVNRILTDRLSDLCFTPSRDGDENLLAEGVAAEKIKLVGNVMIDSLRAALPRAREQGTLERLGVKKGAYALVTLHRPSNVDEPGQLSRLLHQLEALSDLLPVICPLHPRTRARIDHDDLLHAEFGPATRDGKAALRLIEPQGYLDFLALEDGARFVLTDSGGIQEETTALGVPCLTLRDNTERPVTITEGTNQLVGSDPEKIMPAVRALLEGPAREGRIPALWDGHAAERIADELIRFCASRTKP